MASRPFLEVLNRRFRGAFDQRALGAHVGGLRPLPCFRGTRALGVALALGPDPLEFGLDPLDGPEAPARGLVELDFLDAHVVADLVVAALPGERGLGRVASVTHAHPGDVVATGAGEAGEAVRGGEAAVDHGDHAAPRTQDGYLRHGLAGPARGARSGAGLVRPSAAGT
ncbi:hypothetical protein SCWH03_35970 [Streptomyces pacificus]|uniref:Uncharacterized protein n=1 Tax=Streptomyces pacificus TaxID=2705029 RepID=A0A6A0AWQ9_9ACTN|nr:hypothetical protein SCWH03_35970 [Streptomyces pacificus]